MIADLASLEDGHRTMLRTTHRDQPRNPRCQRATVVWRVSPVTKLQASVSLALALATSVQLANDLMHVDEAHRRRAGRKLADLGPTKGRDWYPQRPAPRTSNLHGHAGYRQIGPM